MYFLTFSSNCYSTDFYGEGSSIDSTRLTQSLDVSFAYSTSLHCKFVKSRQPLMTSSTIAVVGPGGADTTPDGRYALYHGTVSTNNAGQPIRHMFAASNQQAGHIMIAEPLQ